MKKTYSRICVVIMAVVMIMSAILAGPAGGEVTVTSPEITIPTVEPDLKIEETDPTVAPTEEPTEEPVVEEPTEEPVVEDPTEEPTEEPVVEEPTEEPTEEPVVEEPTEEPVVEEPTEEPTEEPVVEEPTEEPTEEPVVEEPTEEPTEEPVVEEPTEEPTEEPVVEETTEEPVVEQPTLEPETPVEGEEEEEIITYYDANGNAIPYDENGNLIIPEDIEIDESGNPIFYDAEGNVIPTKVEVEPTEEPAEKFEVSISIIDPKTTYILGDIFSLQSVITGECNNPTYQWQVLDSDNEAAGWVDIEGATEAVYSFEITVENFADSYRVNVTDTDAE